MSYMSRALWLLALLAVPASSHTHGAAHQCNHEHRTDDGGASDHSHDHGIDDGQVLQEAAKEHLYHHLHGSHHHFREHEDHVGAMDQSHAHSNEGELLPEELAEEEELVHHGFLYQRRIATEQSNLTVVWLSALGCSLLVSTASLVCLMLLPFILSNGRPSAVVVDALAGFGAGAMLGDAFLHQLPHAFGSASHVHHEHSHQHDHGHQSGGAHGHSHGIQDLTLGLAVLAGILLFFVVEKLVRYVEWNSGRTGVSSSHAHHHLHKGPMSANVDGRAPTANGHEAEGTEADSKAARDVSPEQSTEPVGKYDGNAGPGEKVAAGQAASGWVLAYLNLFSDGVHNFTDGMALGSAFLLHGSVGGWSRTLFLLAHELPQEVGDFGILVRSGLSVAKALTLNFLSALLAVAGTALALVLGGNPGHSSLIEGFTAGGFIYISVAGVLPGMHEQGSSPKTTLRQLASLSVGVGVAMAISLAE